MSVLNYQQAFYQMQQMLVAVYGEREATAIAHEVLTEITGLGKLERLVQKENVLTQDMYLYLQEWQQRLVAGEPLQYVLGYSWFYGYKFTVNSSVLIPRPETEELVDWIVKDCINTSSGQLLDVGTGSGCIPIAIKKKLATWQITSCDISENAIAVARFNAKEIDADVSFLQLDFLDEVATNALPKYNVIVSNPPYIPATGAASMHKNVLEYEPHLALFVSDNDPLVFYRAIAQFGLTHLHTKGVIYCEIESSLGEATQKLFSSYGYAVELRKDMHGNDRMIRAVLQV